MLPKAHLLADSFNAVDPTKWVAFGTVQQTGAVFISPAANTTNNYSGLVSASRYDLTGSEARIELYAVLNPAPGSKTYFESGLRSHLGCAQARAVPRVLRPVRYTPIDGTRRRRSVGRR